MGYCGQWLHSQRQLLLFRSVPLSYLGVRTWEHYGIWERTLEWPRCWRTSARVVVWVLGFKSLLDLKITKHWCLLVTAGIVASRLQTLDLAEVTLFSLVSVNSNQFTISNCWREECYNNVGRNWGKGIHQGELVNCHWRKHQNGWETEVRVEIFRKCDT